MPQQAPAGPPTNPKTGTPLTWDPTSKAWKDPSTGESFPGAGWSSETQTWDATPGEHRAMTQQADPPWMAALKGEIDRLSSGAGLGGPNDLYEQNAPRLAEASQDALRSRATEYAKSGKFSPDRQKRLSDMNYRQRALDLSKLQGKSSADYWKRREDARSKAMELAGGVADTEQRQKLLDYWQQSQPKNLPSRPGWLTGQDNGAI